MVFHSTLIWGGDGDMGDIRDKNSKYETAILFLFFFWSKLKVFCPGDGRECEYPIFPLHIASRPISDSPFILLVLCHVSIVESWKAILAL